jgi:hypothetical protein
VKERGREKQRVKERGRGDADTRAPPVARGKEVDRLGRKREERRKVGGLRRKKKKRGRKLGWAKREKRGREEGFLFLKLLFKLLKFKLFSNFANFTQT